MRPLRSGNIRVPGMLILCNDWGRAPKSGETDLVEHPVILDTCREPAAANLLALDLL